MAYSGTVVETFPSKFGHGLKVTTQKGEWKLFGKGPPPALKAGEVVWFDAEKKGQSWSYTLVGQGNTAETAQPRPAATPARGNDSEAIFVTGVVGRAMGSGQFGVNEIKMLTVAAVQAYRIWHGAVDEAPDPAPPRPPAPYNRMPPVDDGFPERRG